MAVKGWEDNTFGNLLDIQGGTQPPKDTFVYEPQDGYIRLLQIRDFDHDNRPAYIPDTARSKRCTENDIFIARYGASLGRICTGKSGAYNVALAKVILKTDKIERNFLYFWLNSPHFQDHLLKVGGRSAQAGFNKEDLAPLLLKTPPLPEQKKIAEILGSVDEAITKTEAVIKQTQRVKQGLLQTLFHRGEWDKDQPIPSGFTLSLLGDLAKRGSGHTPDKKKPEYWNGGIKWVSLQDTKKLDKLFISETTAEISDEGIKNSSAALHPAGMVVLSRDATVGRSAITTSKMAVSQHFMAWDCGSGLNKYYLYYWLQHMKPIFELVGVGSTIKTIGLGFFKKLKIPIPSIEEQESSATKLKELDEYLFLQQDYMARLHKTKKGLMADLLTGRVRVSVDQLQEDAA
jgi:type I restriction enzyme S subunit